MGNIIVIIIIVAILAGATAKIILEKRKGAKCIGCPYANGGTGCNMKH